MNKTLPLVLLLAVGCTAVHHVHIVSEPAGARIEVNGDYIGTTPVEYVLVSPFAETIWPYDTQINAYPSEPGQFVQTKWFGHHEQLPTRILFLMHLTPIHVDEATRIEPPPDDSR